MDVDTDTAVDAFQDMTLDQRMALHSRRVQRELDCWSMFQMAVRVFKARLGLGLDVTQQQQRLPFIRLDTVEVLGAVTMVCFVDDAAICEDYSVVEEIFTLAPDRDGTRGRILDLHANPQASGTRFENPEWFRFLSVLKPLGLNAMLTYKPMHTIRGRINGPTTGQCAVTATTTRATTTSLSAAAAAEAREGCSAAPVKVPVLGTPRTKIQDREYRERLYADLVSHVCGVAPLECLRNLGAEIGFTPQDVEGYVCGDTLRPPLGPAPSLPH
jgi:hypothetical protein